jgi:putative DNA primase/helicase
MSGLHLVSPQIADGPFIPHAAAEHREEPFNLTELGNAERLVARHGKDIRYCGPHGKFYVWDGTRWRLDETGEIDRMAKVTVRSIYQEAAHQDEGDLRAKLSKHAVKSEKRDQIASMIHLAKTQPGIPIIPDDLDKDPMLLNVVNGTIDLKTGQLREHRRDELITKLAPVKYDPGAKCPRFQEFLLEIMGGNGRLVEFIQRAIGYSLTGSTKEQVMFILHGNGSNGKSTFLDTIMTVLGDYALQTPTETLVKKADGHEGIPNDVARLKGARFVSANETEDGQKLAESRVKQMTGDRLITARFMRGEFFHFTPEFKLFLAANHKPAIRGTDHGIWRRIRLIPFDVTIADDKQDKDLSQKLSEELPGILAWAVEGCLKWQKCGLVPPPEVTAATNSYRSEMDVLAQFIEDRCLIGEWASAKSSQLYECYSQWCSANGEKPMTQKAFSCRLQERKLRKDRTNSGMIWRGIGIATAEGR